MNTAAAKEFLRKHEVRYVLAQFVDIHGAAKAKAVPVEHLDMVLGDGAGFAGFALWGFGMGPQGPDYMARGDLDTLSLIPWMPGYARIVCNGFVRGEPYPYCSRVALKRQLDKLAARGMTLFTGIEPEFMLLARGADGKLGPCDPTDALDKPCYDYKGLSRAATFLDKMVAALRSVDIDVYQIDHEDANGQFEVNFTYADAHAQRRQLHVRENGGQRDRASVRHDRDLHAQAVLQSHRQWRALPYFHRRLADQESVLRRATMRMAWRCRRWPITSSAASCSMLARWRRSARRP